MVARECYLIRRPSWRMWFSEGLGRFRSRANAIFEYWPSLARVVFMLALGLVVFFRAAIVWQALLMAGAAAGLALLLQQFADPSPLFWAVPGEAMQFVLSAKVRGNHLWLHRTQDLARDSFDSLPKVDGFATRDGFVLMGSGLDASEVRRFSEHSRRILCQPSLTKESSGGCKTSRFLLALSLITGGLVALSAWRGFDIASALLVSALCGGAGYVGAGPAEKLFLPWAGRFRIREDETQTSDLEVEPFWVPSFLWLEGGRAYRVRQIPKAKTLGGGEIGNGCAV
jgi:hypothetical protein